MTTRDEATARVDAAPRFLFVPSKVHERFEKAAHGGTDVVILDLVDGVAPAELSGGREAIAPGWPCLQSGSVPAVERRNTLSTPQAEAAVPIERVQDVLDDLPVLPLTEIAAGPAAPAEVDSERDGLRRVLGHFDVMADTGTVCGADLEVSEVAPLRFAMTVATRTFRFAHPVDGVTIQVNGLERLRSDMQRGVRFGFGGKMCIHPPQVAVTYNICSPTDDERAWPPRVLDADLAAVRAATQFDGKLVDLQARPQARRAMAPAADIGSAR